jgi:acetate kinase
MNRTHRAILVMNAGSSSLKLALIEPRTEQSLCNVLLEQLNTPRGACTLTLADGAKIRRALPDLTHRTGFDAALALVHEQLPGRPEIVAVGHRVVHGGPYFSASRLVTDEVIARIEECCVLAPLHNPWALEGIRMVRERFPELPQVAVFDTAFHQTMPPAAHLYAIPWELYEKHKIRRYGFHGASFHYLTEQTARLLGKPRAGLNLLCAHLGNGCSAVAVRDGRAVDTTMGITPLEGLVMGTRSGDVDPGLFLLLERLEGFGVAESTTLLNQRSGLLGLSGRSNDMREIIAGREAGDARCRVAFDVFCHRLSRALLGLAASLDRLDALVFAGGIGEKAVDVRARVIERLGLLGFRLDPARNAVHGKPTAGRVTRDDSAVPAYVIPTNEELMIARDTAAVIEKRPRGS